MGMLLHYFIVVALLCLFRKELMTELVLGVKGRGYASNS